jgi:hypothetical protein
MNKGNDQKREYEKQMWKQKLEGIERDWAVFGAEVETWGKNTDKAFHPTRKLGNQCEREENK